MHATLSTALLLVTSLVNAQWTSVPSGTLGQLEAVHISDAQEIWAAGKDGVLIRSQDGGDSWSPANVNATDDLNDILRLDANTLLIVGDGGVVLRSITNGALWTTIPTPVSSELVAVHRSGSNVMAVGEQGTILRSVNDGQTWSALNSGSATDLQAVHSNDAQSWWAVGRNGTVLHSVDDGITWSVQPVGTLADLNAVQFISPAVGLIAGDEGVILRTIDGGDNWAPVPSGTGVELQALTVQGAQTVYVCGVSGTIRRSSDGGQSWQAMTTTTTAELIDIRVEQGVGFCVGTGGAVQRLGQVSSGVGETDPMDALLVSAGPQAGSVHVMLGGALAQEATLLLIHAADGRLERGVATAGMTDLEIGGLNAGTHLLQVVGQQGTMGSMRFVVPN